MRHRLLPVLMALLVVMVSACSTKQATAPEPAPSQSQSPAPAPAPEPQVQVIKIGSAGPLSGAFADAGANSLNGLKLAIEDINAAGGIKALGGAKLEVISTDTGSSDPSLAGAQTQKLIDDGAVVVVGDYLSALSLESSTVAEKAGVPFITQSFVDKLTERGYKYTFKVPPHSSAFSNSTLQYVAELFQSAGMKGTRLVGIFSNGAAEQANAKNIEENASKYGMEVLKMITIPADLQDPTTIVADVKRLNPDFIATTAPTNALIQIIRGLRSVGVTVPVVGVGAAGTVEPGFPVALGDAVNGTMTTVAWNWDMDYPGVQDMARRYAEQHKVAFMPQESGETYAIGWIIKEALERAASTDPAKIRDALAQLDLSQSDGLGAAFPGKRLAFDEKGQNKHVVPILVEYIDGVPRTVWPAAEATTAPVLNK